MKNIAVFSSGGDSPGMNACIRAVVRSGAVKGLNVFGIFRGYTGLMNGEFKTLDERCVSNIIQRGGTFLKTARSKDFMTKSGMEKAVSVLNEYKIDGLLGIGGNGTFKGLIDFSKVWDGQIIGLPGTIDNDLYGTDFTIGYNTAVHTAVEAIDKIRDTADAHERYFIVEVMGRDAGFIAIDTGLASGAEDILIPEVSSDLGKISEKVKEYRKKGKKSSIIIVAEGDDAGNAIEVAEKLKKLNGEDFKVSILGYIQRGGNPTPNDRILASKLGFYAVEVFLQGKSGVMVGEIKGELCCTPLLDAVNKKKPVDMRLLDLVEILSV
ncbi:6-phosphofructokinase [bacterium]|nr:6-phosphofructokinase [bacterium]